MITYESLSKKPSIFKGFTGVTIVEFDELLEQATSIWVEQEQRRLDRPDRQRAMGGGCKPKFGLEGQLLVTLVWLRLYLTTEALGFLFGIDKATVSRYSRSILPVLRQVGENTLGWPEPPKRGEGKSIAQARQEHSDLFAFVDATEQPIRRSSNSEIQKDHYSGKKKRHTRKVQIVTNEHGEIRAVSTSVPGSVHDRTLFTQSGIAEKIPKDVVTGGDSGYQGIQTDLPDHSVITPFKKSKHHPLSEEQQALNQEFSRSRIIIENTIGHLKIFKALSERYRHSVELYDDTFRSVVAIVNPRIQMRIALAFAA